MVLRDDLPPVLELLAQSGAVELQAREPAASPWGGEALTDAVRRFDELARRYRVHWPAAGDEPAGPIADPFAAFMQALAQVEVWRDEADPLLDEREHLRERERSLADVIRLLALLPGALQAGGLLGAAGTFVKLRAFALAPGSAPLEAPPGSVGVFVAAADAAFAVLAGRSEDIEAIERQAGARHARPIMLPAHALRVDGPRRAQRIARLQAALAVRRTALERMLAEVARRCALASALAVLVRVEWLLSHREGLSPTARLVRVTGWTTARDAQALCASLGLRAQRCVLHFGPAPAGIEPPARLVNPPLVRTFERFARLLGQPGCNEVDPSVLLALFAPLLFGFMFGDVGQGCVLVAAGLMVRRRAPFLALLIPGGAAAIVFGALFGSVFAREDLLHPLWLQPLQAPLTVLAVALAIGVVILLCGLLLDAVQASWRGQLSAWLVRDAGFLLAYLGLAGAALRTELIWLVAPGAAWYTIGGTLAAGGGRARAFGAALASFAERGLQLAVNTLSFARVGAFALAHAGLSAAVVALAEAAGPGAGWIVLLAGNLLILVLEGLVVGIQTTRLLLFEFFVRFLEGTGRVFKPLPPPFVRNLSSIEESR
jgi:V/A-type H+-transporting ATPase subunit I